MADETCPNVVLMVLATWGRMAPAVTATKPPMRVYSMRSCPLQFFQARVRKVTI
jgi:hypothetical protein